MTVGFTCIQVYVGNSYPPKVRGKIVDALRDKARTEHYEEVPDVDLFQADRLLIVGPLDPEPWVAVWDYYRNWFMYFDVWQLAQSLSQAIRETVVSFYANDPILRLDLYERGALADRFSNYPEKFGAQTDDEKQSFGGKPMKWQRLLIPGAKPVDLERAWSERTIEVTQNTSQVGKLLGMNPERIWHVQPTSSAMNDRSFTVLKFRETDEWYESYKRERLT